jgi:hypothetical protein
MSIIVIGGHSRSVGKTSVVAGLISALPDFHWTAFKITQYGHGICSAKGEACDCATGDHSWAMTAEKNRAADSDTSRILAAGAERVWWVRTEQGRLAEAMPAVRERLKDSPHVIIESNSILKFLRPDLYITVLDPATADFKVSAREFLDRADAAILHQMRNGDPAWKDVSLKPVTGKPLFRITPPPYVTLEIVEFTRASLFRSQQKQRSS